MSQNKSMLPNQIRERSEKMLNRLFHNNSIDEEFYEHFQILMEEYYNLNSEDFNEHFERIVIDLCNEDSTIDFHRIYGICKDIGFDYEKRHNILEAIIEMDLPHLNVVNDLLDLDIDINYDNGGLICTACYLHKDELINLLIERGANPCVRDNTPIHLYCNEKSSREILDILVKKGAMIDRECLANACRTDNDVAINYLLENGLTVDDEILNIMKPDFFSYLLDKELIEKNKVIKILLNDLIKIDTDVLIEWSGIIEKIDEKIFSNELKIHMDSLIIEFMKLIKKED